MYRGCPLFGGSVIRGFTVYQRWKIQTCLAEEELRTPRRSLFRDVNQCCKEAFVAIKRTVDALDVHQKVVDNRSSFLTMYLPP